MKTDHGIWQYGDHGDFGKSYFGEVVVKDWSRCIRLNDKDTWAQEKVNRPMEQI